MPERFLLQILRNLVTRGILESTRGVDGGYRLVRDADEISLLDVIEAIDGPLNSILPIIDGLPQGCATNLARVVTGVTEHARRELQATKLTHLLPSLNGHMRDKA
jgi:Rrf2 family protein